MASRTQIVCLCEGEKGKSIDEVFINRLIKSLDPSWLRPLRGSNTLRIVSCGGRTQVIEKMPQELKNCIKAGSNTTLMVFAECDHDCVDGGTLKADFWKESQRQSITKEDFDSVVFIFAKDRLENWIEYLQTGKCNEDVESPRVRNGREVADAARKLASFCRDGKQIDGLPPSLKWSCKNWRLLVARMSI